MAYEKQTFTDNETILTAAMLQHIEEGIVANEEANSKLSDEKVTIPSSGSVEQILAVKTVDATGKPTEFECVDKPATPEIPTALKNPYSLKFTGAVTKNYDGSEEVSVNIPQSYTLPIATSETLGGVKPVAKTDAMTQPVGVDANGALYTASGGESGGGTPQTEKLLDVTFDEATASISVTLEHDFYKLFLIWNDPTGVARTVDADGAAVNSDLRVMLDTNSTTWNPRQIGAIEGSTDLWQTDALTMEWSSDLSVYFGSSHVSVGMVSANKYVCQKGGGVGSFFGTVGNSDALTPQSGRTIYVLPRSGLFAANTRIVLVGEYYE